MKINIKKDSPLNKFLNSLDQLERLYVYDSEVHSSDLFLPNLKRAEFTFMQINELVLRAPQLSSIRISDCKIKYLDLSYIDTISELFLGTFYPFLLKYKFENLKYLNFEKLNQCPNEEWLLNCKKLKNLHFKSNEEIFNSIVKLKADHNLKFIIYFFDLCLHDLNDYNRCFENEENYESLTQDLLVLYQKFYAELPEYLSFYKIIDYSVLERLDFEFPNEFYEFKLCNLFQIKITKEIEDKERFFKLLRKLKFIKKIYIYNEMQSQDVFDQLPNYCQSLYSLQIEANDSNQLTKLNFDFLGRFNELSFLFINQEIELDSIESILKNVKSLSLFVFRYKEFLIKLSSLENEGAFQLEKVNEHRIGLNFKSQDDLILFLKNKLNWSRLMVYMLTKKKQDLIFLIIFFYILATLLRILIYHFSETEEEVIEKIIC